MEVTINGKCYMVEESMNVCQIINMYGITDLTNVVIELNGDIIKSDMWQTTIVEDKDKVEIVSFVGGG